MKSDIMSKPLDVYVMKETTDWWQTPWWHFWNPDSGLFGGYVAGILLVAPVVLAVIFKWM
jgi:hypothetical protein